MICCLSDVFFGTDGLLIFRCSWRRSHGAAGSGLRVLPERRLARFRGEDPRPGGFNHGLLCPRGTFIYDHF